MNALRVVLISTFTLVGCAATPPPIKTNERPTILDHPSVLDVAEFDQHRTPDEFVSALEGGRTFGYCLPVGAPSGKRPILCFVTELGEAYVVLDHSLEEDPKVLYEIASVVRRKGTRYYVPSFDTVGDFKN